MQNQISPLILSFGASDPVTATGLYADLASFAAMGCHGLPIVTAILTGDTAQVDSIHPLEADLVDEQARTILEDMAVVTFKIGQVGSVDNATTIAEIVSDYPEMPLILDPFNSAVTEQIADAEDLTLAKIIKISLKTGISQEAYLVHHFKVEQIVSNTKLRTCWK